MRLFSLVCVLCLSIAATLAESATASAAALFGDQTIEPTVDWNAAGVAQAWPFSNSTNATTTSISVYVDSANTAATLIVGLYADNNGSPGSRLASGSLSHPTTGAWNTINIGSAPVSSGKTYWVAVLGASGTPHFRDRFNANCHSQGSAQNNLTSLPSTWSTGPVWGYCPVSAYVNGSPTTAGAVPSNTAPPTLSGTHHPGPDTDHHQR